jgi:hypothetical protein
MKAVGHLDSLRSASPGSISVGAGPIAADDLDAGMGLEPGEDGLGLAVWNRKPLCAVDPLNILS